MTPKDFTALEFPIQTKLTQLYGVPVASIIEHSILTTLYQLDSFYIELTFRPRVSRVVKCKVVEDDRLDEYLDNIDLNQLTNG